MSEEPKLSPAGPADPIAALTAADLQALFEPPDRVGLPSSWWGHVPLAHWMVQELKPRVIVELGTHHGISFSAFCNAVRREGLAARCYAVDTWQGDEQAGFYDESVFESIDAFVRQTYSSFATLLRCPFDAAIGTFEDGSIDLLHIDGQHSYEAVEADFRAWLPKLSDRGVVLFHDTQIYLPGFGVWRFWKEISPRHPSFEFHNSCGLGLLAPGKEVPAFVSALVGMNPATATALRHRLAELGERWISLDEKARMAVTLHGLQHAQQLAQAENTRLQREALLHAGAADEARAAAAALRQEVAALEAGSALQRTELAAYVSHADALSQQLGAATRQAERLRLQLEGVRRSTSWRVMGPYRVAGRLLKRRVLTPLLASPLQRQRLRDVEVISGSKAFNSAFYLGRNVAPEDEDGVLMDYLVASHAGAPRGRQQPGAPQRRPMPGFHPLAYAAQCEAYDEGTGEDPLAHFLRTGSPAGPWKHPVILPHTPPADAGTGLRLLVHAHFHYPDLLEPLLQRLRHNGLRPDLFITTTSEAKAAEIAQVLAARDQRATTMVVPNRGRDIGPLLMHFDVLKGYDVVGHLHGKRSPQQPGAEGGNWRNFLWEHLAGGEWPMVDVIAAAFAADERLGLVFPEDPNLNHWDMNPSLADDLARRIGLREALPPHFEFPKGGMFWARPAALRPLVDLGWSWGDFPIEPAASDGTVLHALERLVTFSAEHAGLGFAAVHVPGSWRA